MATIIIIPTTYTLGYYKQLKVIQSNFPPACFTVDFSFKSIPQHSLPCRTSKVLDQLPNYSMKRFCIFFKTATFFLHVLGAHIPPPCKYAATPTLPTEGSVLTGLWVYHRHS